jgi:hypothetical protein
MRNLIILVSIAAGLTACTSKSTSGRSKFGGDRTLTKPGNPTDGTTNGDRTGKSGDATDPAADGKKKDVNWDEVPVIEKARPETRSYTEILCQEGLKVANTPKKDDFTYAFSAICKDGEVTDSFKNAVANAYNGTNEPTVELISASTDEQFLTKLLFIYAIEVPLNGPTEFHDLKIYDKLQNDGVADASSRLAMKVESRKAFPGKASVEEVILEQRIEMAAGAALYDVRRTELNNYLLVENMRDINLTTEHLLDADKNEHYHIARGLLVGMKGATAGVTNLVYVTELEVKNRIDPARLQKTVLNLAKVIQTKIYERSKEPSAE